MPVSNYLILIFMTVVFALQFYYPNPERLERFICRDLSFEGLIGHMWLHGNMVHIIGNLIFLWVFGNAVCAKIGNIFYPIIYIVLGIAAGAASIVYNDQPCIGASGAIFGIVGFYFVLYPYNKVECLLIYILIKRIRLAGLWVIMWWIALNVLGIFFLGDSQVGYMGHIAGFLAGTSLAIILVQLRVVERENTGRELLMQMHK